MKTSRSICCSQQLPSGFPLRSSLFLCMSVNGIAFFAFRL